jgi:hypothetical protein
MIGRVLLAVLAVGVAVTAFAVFIDFPSDPVFLKAAASLIVLTLTLTCALLSSLTLSTRYVIVGVLGIAAAVLAMVNGLYSVWNDKLGSGISGLAASSPAEAFTDYVGSSDGNSVGSAVMIFIALTSLALPLINVVLYLAYDSNPVGEFLGVATVAAMLAGIIIIGVTTATGKSDEASAKWLVFLSIFAVAGFIGTLAASFLDSDRAIGRGVHYDIKSDSLPSALPSSFQPPKQERKTTVTVEDDDPVLPALQYPGDDR